MSHSIIPLILIALFLLASTGFHIAQPDLAQNVLSVSTNIQVVGIILTLLGALALTNRSIYSKAVGTLILLSGLSRAVSPDRIININEWADKSTHGILMGIGAFIVLYIAYRVQSLNKH